ncbi:Asp-tRNA(Asn)/Glu-tRNA(Gln) amidotransferase subunit GatB [Bythopirellula polymerisocia]|uniref:Aspartyl/glutamyl-tRNA(Asn/Gln) amidotransferase subunit B n=1 Tax=Bythopirellula polymerisocia TaxID=2528003 RepID=A0A5C6CS01_9BACT|nr:Asp-tRNA(Asn)/Glu-tRNA(Gln) amidotransferase subunit GatB [Bythopirellula polymerisocia]TWU27330.1 Aspartyl/glutamyl-tRNA(Asn/Gln) amidotransferase subunit B [Bythopirellula polymerisocia]
MSQLYTTVIGLEVHVQLATKSKLFCRCSTQFGAEPNTQTCSVCLGLPGSLPVMNRTAFDLSLKTAVALNCVIPKFTKWDRKQYYYPDLPKAYQISQYDLPMSSAGWLEISDEKGSFEPKRVRITRAHLEEDAGKSIHDEAAGKADSEIDLNRTGTPLLEIVSEPDLSSSAEAKAYLQELKLLLTHIGVSDCNMQEGSLRVDANINLHIDTPEGKIATPIVEIKNMNSFRAVERALDYEAPRQFRVWQETGQKIGEAPKQTRGWDDSAGVTRGQRSKEESSDYRYFPDPDLVPVLVTDDQVAEARKSLGELPADLRNRFVQEYGLSAYDASVIVNQGQGVTNYFEQVARESGDAKSACKWVTQDILRLLKDGEQEINAIGVSAANLAGMISAVNDGKLPKPRAKEAFELMLSTGSTAQQAIQELGIEQVDESALVELCRELLDKNPRVVADVQSGKVQAIGALIGQAKKLNPNVDPGRFREICLELAMESSSSE